MMGPTNWRKNKGGSQFIAYLQLQIQMLSLSLLYFPKYSNQNRVITIFAPFSTCEPVAVRPINGVGPGRRLLEFPLVRKNFLPRD